MIKTIPLAIAMLICVANSFVANLDWDLKQIDIVTALLNGESEGEFSKFGDGKLY